VDERLELRTLLRVATLVADHVRSIDLAEVDGVLASAHSGVGALLAASGGIDLLLINRLV